MYVADAKRLTLAGATEDDGHRDGRAEEAGIAVTVAIVDAGGPPGAARAHGRRALPHRALGHHQGGVRRVEQAADHRPKGAQGQALDTAHALGLALAAGPERWTAMEGGCPIIVDGECIGGIGVSRRQLGVRRARRARSAVGVDRRELRRNGDAVEPLRVACIGMGWWSDVLADAIKRSGKLKIVACYTRSEDKREAFAAKYGCRRRAELRGDARRPDASRRSSTPRRTTCTSRPRAPRPRAGKHVFLDKPIANTVADARAITAGVPQGRRRARARLPAPPRKPVPLDHASRSTTASSAGWSTPRPTSAATGWARSTSRSWRYTAEGMPGGVMLQIGIHYTDVLEYLIGPVKAVSGQSRAARAARRQPRRREPGARARERRALDAQRELRLGVRVLRDEHLRQGGERLLRPAPGPALPQARRAERSMPVAVREERHDRRGARGVRRRGARRRASPKWTASAPRASLAVLRAGIKSAREGRRVRSRRVLARGAHETRDRFCCAHCLLALALAGAQEPPFPQRGNDRDHGAVPRRLLGRRHGAAARRGHGEAARPANVIVVNRPGAGGAIGYKHVAAPEARRLLAGLELELDLDHVPLRPARVRLQGVRSGGAGAGRVAGASRCAATRSWKTLGDLIADAKARPKADHRRQLRHRQPHAHLVGRRCSAPAGVEVDRRAVRRGAGGAEPARRPRRRGGAASRRARRAREAGPGAPPRRADPEPRSGAARRAHRAASRASTSRSKPGAASRCREARRAPSIAALENAIRSTVESAGIRAGQREARRAPGVPAGGGVRRADREGGRSLSRLMQLIGLKKTP